MQENHNKQQVLTCGGCTVICIEGKKVHEEKSHCTGTEQQIPSMFAHHLINTSRFLPGAVFFQAWREGLDTALSPQGYFYPQTEDF